jgi:hypothetical protein
MPPQQNESIERSTVYCIDGIASCTLARQHASGVTHRHGADRRNRDRFPCHDQSLR